ncbi:hypothetical protein PUN28_017071 [Cardiocondyla obscurior]|uniref:Uncharacterized protein n=1 Tax=Cardiocondyla obscurior TaxID=286306 RepID=A0AAW2EK56_9HYME
MTLKYKEYSFIEHCNDYLCCCWGDKTALEINVIPYSCNLTLQALDALDVKYLANVSTRRLIEKRIKCRFVSKDVQCNVLRGGAGPEWTSGIGGATLGSSLIHSAAAHRLITR